MDHSSADAAMTNHSCDDATHPVYTMVAKWGKERIVVEDLAASTSIGTVKDRLTEKTGVLQIRQKLIGLAAVNGGARAINDDLTLADLKVKNNNAARNKSSAGSNAGADQDRKVIVHEFLLMGTAEKDIFVDPSERDDLPDVVDDFDLDFNAGSDEWLEHVANGENLKKFTEHTSVHIMAPPRDKKPLLVLDLDHTLLDFSRKTLERDSGTDQVGEGSAATMKRPHMDEFLVEAYKHYDLVVWSQTSWRWLETKLTELGMITHPGYKFVFVLDKTSMFTVKSTKRDGSSYVHHVKPLQLIWTKFPQWGSHNTVHVDDLFRNFALNLTSGLRVSAFHRKRSVATRDKELLGLKTYLERLAKSNLSFDDVNFEHWLDVVNGKRSLADKD
jgi:ubiquitin-like domain-containing CTD phosphatase 1